MCFQMTPQTVCTRRCIVTLVTFVWFFSAVRFQMCPQIACPRECKVTLVAFVWFFSSVRFQMSPQISCLRRCKVTLVTSVCLFSAMCFQMCSQLACLRGYIITLVAFVWLFSVVFIPFHWNLHAGFAFIWLILSKILIHYQHKETVVSCVMLVLNWVKIKMTNWIVSRKSESDQLLMSNFD